MLKARPVHMHAHQFSLHRKCSRSISSTGSFSWCAADAGGNSYSRAPKRAVTPDLPLTGMSHPGDAIHTRGDTPQLALQHCWLFMQASPSCAPAQAANIF